MVSWVWYVESNASDAIETLRKCLAHKCNVKHSGRKTTKPHGLLCKSGVVEATVRWQAPQNLASSSPPSRTLMLSVSSKCSSTRFLDNSVSRFDLGRCRRLWRHGQDRLDDLQGPQKNWTWMSEASFKTSWSPREVGMSCLRCFWRHLCWWRDGFQHLHCTHGRCSQSHQRDGGAAGLPWCHRFFEVLLSQWWSSHRRGFQRR